MQCCKHHTCEELLPCGMLVSCQQQADAAVGISLPPQTIAAGRQNMAHVAQHQNHTRDYARATNICCSMIQLEHSTYINQQTDRDQLRIMLAAAVDGNSRHQPRNIHNTKTAQHLILQVRSKLQTQLLTKPCTMTRHCIHLPKAV